MKRPSIVKQNVRLPSTVLHILVTLVLLTMVVLSACYKNIDHEESLTFYFLKNNELRLLFGTANTHWLNSFFMSLWMAIFGNEAFVLRLHSIIALPFYATGIYRLSRHIDSRFWAFLFYVFALFNPYILDFFTVARGYALAFTFQVWLLCFAIPIYRDNNFSAKKWWRVWLCSALMLLSNLSFLYTVFGVVGMFFLQILTRQPGYDLNKNTLKIIVGFALLIAAAATNLMLIKYAGDLWLGGDNAINSIFNTVWHGYTFFYEIEILPQILTGFTLVGIAVSSGYFLYQSIKNKRISAGLFLAGLVIGLVALNVFFNLAFSTPYLEKRTALQWWLPFTVLLFLFFNEITKYKKGFFGKKILAITAGILLFAQLAYLFKSSFDYRMSRRQYEQPILRHLYELQPNHVGLGVHFYVIFRNYYRYTEPGYDQIQYSMLRDKHLTNCTGEKSWDKLADYDYITISDPKAVDCMQQRNINFEVVQTYGKYQIIHLIGE